MNNIQKKTKRYKKNKWVKKKCYFNDESIVWIDYKDANLLKKFINNQGKILSARETGTKIKMQRKLSIAIKRARHIGLLPFTLQARMKYKRNLEKEMK